MPVCQAELQTQHREADNEEFKKVDLGVAGENQLPKNQNKRQHVS